MKKVKKYVLIAIQAMIILIVCSGIFLFWFAIGVLFLMAQSIGWASDAIRLKRAKMKLNAGVT